MENTISGERAVVEMGTKKKVPLVAHSESSEKQTPKEPRRTTKMSKLTLATRLQILGDVLMGLQDDGLLVSLQRYDKNGVTGTVVFLNNVQVLDGTLTPVGIANDAGVTPNPPTSTAV